MRRGYPDRDLGLDLAVELDRLELIESLKTKTMSHRPYRAERTRQSRMPSTQPLGSLWSLRVGRIG